jgi:predicted negative regulator of RcsB-dependent stress response
MATLQTDEANIIDAEAVNWRLIVYPLLLVLILGAGAFGYYYYLQNQRDEAETNARVALVKATTPEEFLKVAEQFPHTDQAMLAILRAADASLDKHDYDAALDDYRKITDNVAISAQWHDTAELGIASASEAGNNTDRAIAAYLEVAQRGDKSPYAPYAYNAVARIYEQRGDKNSERQVLEEAAALDPGSAFTKQAQNKLKELTAAPQPSMSFPVPSAPETLSPASAPAAPAPTPPTK